MEWLAPDMTLSVFAICAAIAFFAGTVKGLVGFALPLIMVSGLSSVIEPQWALAALLLPTLLSNWWQALRQGAGAALGSLKQFRLFIIVGGVMLALSAQFVRVVPADVMFLIIGVPVVAFTLMQLAGVRPRIDGRQRVWAELGVGTLAGAMGGFSGTWGPPTVLFLVAIGTPKLDMVRIQGVLYGLGSVVLMIAHIGSGVLRWETLPFAVSMTVPALLGMALGLSLQDRTPQRQFQIATMVVLVLAGLNLIRRGLTG